MVFCFLLGTRITRKSKKLFSCFFSIVSTEIVLLWPRICVRFCLFFHVCWTQFAAAILVIVDDEGVRNIRTIVVSVATQHTRRHSARDLISSAIVLGIT